MTITKLEGGGVVIEGKSIRTAQLLVLVGALKLEQKGLKRRGRSAVAIARETTGLMTRDKTLLIEAVELMAEANERGLDCPLCKAKASVVALDKETLAQQTDGTTHVCHPLLGGCNHGFAV